MEEVTLIASVAVLLVALVAGSLDQRRYGGWAFGLAAVWFAWVALTSEGLLVWAAAAVSALNVTKAALWVRDRKRAIPEDAPA